MSDWRKTLDSDILRANTANEQPFDLVEQQKAKAKTRHEKERGCDQHTQKTFRNEKKQQQTRKGTTQTKIHSNTHDKMNNRNRIACRYKQISKTQNCPEKHKNKSKHIKKN